MIKTFDPNKKKLNKLDQFSLKKPFNLTLTITIKQAKPKQDK